MGRKLLVATLSKCGSLICANLKQSPKTASCSTFHNKILLRRSLSSAVFAYVQTQTNFRNSFIQQIPLGERFRREMPAMLCFHMYKPNQTAVLLGKTFRYSPHEKKKYPSILLIARVGSRMARPIELSWNVVCLQFVHMPGQRKHTSRTVPLVCLRKSL